MIATIDFETYSEAGYEWSGVKQRWQSITGKPPGGISAVGAAVYSEHPTTEVLCMAYDMGDGVPNLWLPWMPPPKRLLDHIADGGLVEAHNSMFEYLIWSNVCVRRYGWPPLPQKQLRCSASKCRAWGLPGALANAGAALELAQQKDTKGKSLIDKYCKPRNPTKADASLRAQPHSDLYSYCIQDITTEEELSKTTPPLYYTELDVWLTDQRINARGVHVDMDGLERCIDTYGRLADRALTELRGLTNNDVQTPNEVKNMTEWLAAHSVYTNSLDADHVAALLARDDLPTNVRRVIEIRDEFAASSVKKLYTMRNMACRDNRIRDMFVYCGAERTGRWAGRGPQPQNLPSATVKDVDATLNALNSVADIAGCLRGLFCAPPGHDLISSDYSAIEAVVLAMLAGEQWRIDVFNTHGMIYEMSAAKITNTPFEEFTAHKQETGDHHPLRKTIGKVAELASGYQGSVGAWKAFGADKHMGSDDEILAAVRRWREESPNIVRLWYGLEACAVAAVNMPGTMQTYRGITYVVSKDVLYCILLSGRKLAYHKPRLTPDVTPWGERKMKLSFMGWNSIARKWERTDTYGGKLTENLVQATARDILAHALVQLDAKGYPVVMHIHDEIVSEVPKGFGSVEEFEAIMSTMPPWAEGWPVVAKGGWRGKRYRKE